MRIFRYQIHWLKPQVVGVSFVLAKSRKEAIHKARIGEDEDYHIPRTTIKDDPSIDDVIEISLD